MITAADKVTLKLEGRLKRLTVTVLLKTGRTIQFQSDEPPETNFDAASREVVISTGYKSLSLIPWNNIDAIVSEENNTQL